MWPVALDALIVPTVLSCLNGIALCVLYAVSPRIRKSVYAQLFTWIYLFCSFALYFSQLPASSAAPTDRDYLMYLLAVAAYVPVLTYLCSSLLELAIHTVTWIIPTRGTWRRRRWRRCLQKVAQGRDRRVLQRKLAEVQRSPADPVVRREIIELFLSRAEPENAVYHAYVLVELLPHGHAHAFALYRLTQIMVDQLGDLERAQPFLRRIIRGYPRSFFASYARRLVNQYEAYADREI